MTIPGEMARVTGLPRPEAGRGNRALVAEGYATMPVPGVYQLAAVRALEEEVGRHAQANRDTTGECQALLLAGHPVHPVGGSE